MKYKINDIIEVQYSKYTKTYRNLITRIENNRYIGECLAVKQISQKHFYPADRDVLAFNQSTVFIDTHISKLIGTKDTHPEYLL